MLKNKTILYLVHDYNTFQKDPVEEASKYFKKVYVLARYKPISRIVKYLPFNRLKQYEDSYVVNMRNVPSNVEVIKVPVWYLPFGIFNYFAGDAHYRAAKRIIRRHNIKFDLIHSHFTWTAGYAGMRLREDYGRPFVLTVHEDNNWLDKELNSKDERIYNIWRSADILFRVNKRTIKDLRKYNDNVIYTSNSFNENLFFPQDKQKSRKELNLNLNEKILLNVGYLEGYKGQIYLIKAFDILLKKYKRDNIKLYIIGEGSMRSILESEIEKLNLKERVILLGKQLHKDIPVWMNACDLFVLPSLSESFGIVQIEAFACGKPVVASKNEGSKEVVTSEEYGLLCEIADPEDLAEKINKALEKKWDEKKIIDYSNMFKQENLLKEQIKEYEKVIKN